MRKTGLGRVMRREFKRGQEAERESREERETGAGVRESERRLEKGEMMSERRCGEREKRGGEREREKIEIEKVILFNPNINKLQG